MDICAKCSKFICLLQVGAICYVTAENEYCSLNSDNDEYLANQ